MTTFILRRNTDRNPTIAKVAAFLEAMPAGEPVVVTIDDDEIRSDEQSRRMYAMCDDVSDQVPWYGKRLNRYEWKDVFTAALRRSLVVPGLDGGFVVVGASTRRMSKKTMTDLIELIFAFGAERGVKWSDE